MKPSCQDLSARDSSSSSESPHPTTTDGWNNFCRKKLNTCQFVPNRFRIPIQKKKFKCCFLVWRRDSENFEFYPKIGKNKFLFKRFRDLHQRGKSSLIFVKLKMKRNSKTFGYFLCTS